MLAGKTINPSIDKPFKVKTLEAFMVQINNLLLFYCYLAFYFLDKYSFLIREGVWISFPGT